ncbi:MAG: aminomethyltransferase family protein [Candidatus Njordarchaeales archaeon]
MNSLMEYHISHRAVIKKYGASKAPAEYTGFQKEYNAVRNTVGLFDFSITSKIRILGRESSYFLDKLLAGNVRMMDEGKVLNTLFCREDGTILAIIWLLKNERDFIILTDAGKKEAVLKQLNKYINDFESVELEDISELYSCLSIIGPRAIEIARLIVGDDIVGLPYLGFQHSDIERTDCLLCRIGYTGEYEYKFLIPSEISLKLWEKIINVGKGCGLVLCGLEVLDTLMLEMKSINQNKDLLKDTTCLQAGLHWMVYFKKGSFIGKEAIFKEKSHGVTRKLLSVLFNGGGKIGERAGIYLGEEKVGFVIHNKYSPTMSKDVGLAYLDGRYAWAGLSFKAETIDKQRRNIRTVSAPLFITKTVREAQI